MFLEQTVSHPTAWEFQHLSFPLPDRQSLLFKINYNLPIFVKNNKNTCFPLDFISHHDMDVNVVPHKLCLELVACKWGLAVPRMLTFLPETPFLFVLNESTYQRTLSFLTPYIFLRSKNAVGCAGLT